jgi:hypothetical protein
VSANANTKRGVPLRAVVAAAVVLTCALYVPKIVWPDARFYAEVLTPTRVQLVGAFAKLVCLVLSTVYGFRVAKRLEHANPARRPWFLLGVWLACWTFGQVGLMVYPFLLGREPPVPSIADCGYLAGFVFLFPALVRFITAYRESGFPVGSAREHAVIAGVTAVVVGAFSWANLAGLARSEDTAMVRFLNVVYPAGDLLAVVPTVVLIRIALAFRPGRVWGVWAAITTGFLFLAAGDFLSTFLWPETTSFDPAVHLTYLLGYVFVACGMKLQDELVSR